MYDIHIEGLRKWIKPFINELNFTSQDLKVFLPGSDKGVGDVWDIVLPITSKFGEKDQYNICLDYCTCMWMIIIYIAKQFVWKIG